MRIHTVVALLVAVVLSGCAGDSDTFEPTSDVPPAQGEDGNSTATPETPGGSDANGTVDNLVPTLSFTADVVNGTAPLLVNFTIDVEDDSEEFAWTFFVNGTEALTGTDVPATFNHTFDAGSFNVTLDLTDGEHTASAGVAVTAIVADTEPAGPVQTESGDFIGVASGCDNTVGVLGFPGLLGEENERFDLEPTTAGGTFTIAFQSEGPAVRYYLVYYGEGGAGVGGARPSESATYSGDIPDAATYFRIGVCAGGETSFTYEGYTPA